MFGGLVGEAENKLIKAQVSIAFTMRELYGYKADLYVGYDDLAAMINNHKDTFVWFGKSFNVGLAHMKQLGNNLTLPAWRSSFRTFFVNLSIRSLFGKLLLIKGNEMSLNHAKGDYAIKYIN